MPENDDGILAFFSFFLLTFFYFFYFFIFDLCLIILVATHFHASSFVETFLVLLFATSWCHKYIIVDSIADMLLHVLCRHIITEQHGIQHSTREAKQIIVH